MGKSYIALIVTAIAVLGLASYRGYEAMKETMSTTDEISEAATMSVSAFSRGVRLEVTVNDTNPSTGDVVGIEVSITNVNSTERVFWGGINLVLEVLNSGGVKVYELGVWYPTPTPPVGLVELTKNKTYSHTVEWRAETSPYFDVEVKSGETYHIIVTCRLGTDTGNPIELSTEPIKVTTR